VLLLCRLRWKERGKYFEPFIGMALICTSHNQGSYMHAFYQVKERDSKASSYISDSAFAFTAIIPTEFVVFYLSYYLHKLPVAVHKNI
jgi:hypothetical protein